MGIDIFLEISLILVIATGVSMVMHWLRQPLIIGHILTGLLIGPSLLNLVHSTEIVETLSRFGVALLLFIIGLGLNPRVIKEVGKVAVMTGLGQVFFTASIGFVIARALGLLSIPALYVAVALTFSSTIIILKLLSDKRELSRLHGKIATGFLLVQDIVAAFALIFITTFVGDTSNASVQSLIIETVSKGAIFVVGLLTFTKFILARLSSIFAQSQEFLFLFAIGWGFGVASVCALLGFSIEIGALAAGVAMASSPYSYEISSRMKPLRDFFIILFFILLGAGMNLAGIGGDLYRVAIFSIFILVGNPIIVMTIMGLLGYTKKTSFKAGLAVAQISEFSLILILLGQQVGQVPPNVASMITLVGLVTIAASTYLIIYSDSLYNRLAPMLRIFERKKLRSDRTESESYEVILFGYKGGSSALTKSFKKLTNSFLIVDYDPETIDRLGEQGIATRYGDANDAEFLEELELSKVKLAIVNVTDFATNTLIVNHVRGHNARAVIIATAKSDQPEQAQQLYEAGANYVLMPRLLSADYLTKLISRHGVSKARFNEERIKHLKYLAEVSS